MFSNRNIFPKGFKVSKFLFKITLFQKNFESSKNPQYFFKKDIVWKKFKKGSKFLQKVFKNSFENFSKSFQNSFHCFSTFFETKFRKRFKKFSKCFLRKKIEKMFKHCSKILFQKISKVSNILFSKSIFKWNFKKV